MFAKVVRFAGIVSGVEHQATVLMESISSVKPTTQKRKTISPVAEGRITNTPLDTYGKVTIQPVGNSRYLVCIVVLLVLCLHITALAVLFHRSPSANKVVTPPTIAGVLIKMPKENVVEAPKVNKTAVLPKPLIQPEPVLASKPKPKVMPPPLAKALSSDEAITLSKPTVEELPPSEVIETPVTPEASDIPSQPVDVVKTKKRQKPESPVAPPRLDATHLNNPAPIYPRTSLRLRQEGTVILKLLIRADGTVGETSIKTSSGYQRLDKAALKAVRRWHYVAARHGDETVDFWYEQPIVFSLRQ